MKKNIILAFTLVSFTAFSQTTLYNGDGTLSSNRVVILNGKTLNFKANSGNLFVNGTNGFTGINTTAPTVPLEVAGDLKARTGIFTKSTANGQTFSSEDALVNASLVLSAGSIPTGSTTQFRLFTFMDVPSSNYEAQPTQWFQINNRNNFTRLRFRSADNADSQFTLYDKFQGENFVFLDDGAGSIGFYMPKENTKVCIGTTSFTDGTDVYSLSVNGNVRAKRVKVYTTWADYVFEDGYKLPTLEEVEKYIAEEGHLQDIPSAAEVEVKGIELGEMNKLLLQKVEELTLYVIELNKQVQELKKQSNK